MQSYGMRKNAKKLGLREEKVNRDLDPDPADADPEVRRNSNRRSCWRSSEELGGVAGDLPECGRG